MSTAAFALAEHQTVAVELVLSLLDRFGGALLADEPGLGKSFVAAAVARVARTDCEVELIVPASLIAQWEETLRSFGVQARITTPDRIINEPFIAPPRQRLIIVDEAHAFRNPGTLRYAALARRSVAARLLLVTATPLCNSARDLEALFRLLVCDDALAAYGVPSIDAAFEQRDRLAIGDIVSLLVVRRDRTVLPNHLRFGVLDRSVIRYDIAPELTSAIESLRLPLVGDLSIVHHFLKRRLESSAAALIESLQRQRRFYERALECLSSGRSLPKRDYRRAFAHEEDAAAYQRILFWEVFVPPGATADVFELDDELARIDQLINAVEGSDRVKRDRLVEVCKATEPSLVFTGWAATAIDLAAALRPFRRVALVTGRERSRAAQSIETFRRGHADVLVCTDLAAEGLNLQRAGIVIHYDVPWNPVKLDQRNGRAHRIGQRRDSVRAVYFLPRRDDTGILQTMAAKNRTRRGILHESRRRQTVSQTTSIRPRVAADAAIIAFTSAAATRGWHVPESLLRRHRAGVEALLTDLCDEYIDEAKLRDLEDVLALEPWARSRPVRFTPL